MAIYDSMQFVPCDVNTVPPAPLRPLKIRPISLLRLWISEGSTHAELKFKGWNSHVHREFPGKFESTNLGRDHLRRAIGGICR